MESPSLMVTHFNASVVMKMILYLLTFLFCEAAIALGDVSLSIYEADGTTPFDSRNIIIGTKLTIIISSDSVDYWSGGVFLAGDNRGLGVLSARGWDPNTLDWAGSRTEAAGTMATVWKYYDSWLWGCDVYTDSYDVEAGDWFILDYEATAVGDPNFGFYDYSQGWDEPVSTVTFTQVPSPDFDDDGVVNFVDFAHFSLYWLESDCQETSWCWGADLNTDTVVDMQDLALFSDYWLWGAPDTEPPVDPNEPPPGGGEPPGEDPNQPFGITYRIVNPQLLQEITLSLGEHVTLYVDKVTEGEGNISSFYVEVDISDPNLGWIDNTPYDPNDPPGSGTARILAEPNRLTEFDYWEPGTMQEEGIDLSGATWNEGIYDGALASFVYTCEGIGDVILELYDWDSYNTENQKVYPQTEYIIIHQVNPNSQQMMMSGGMEQSSLTTQRDPKTQLIEYDLKETLRWLDEIWNDESMALQEQITEEEWQEFIRRVADYYGTPN